MLLLLLFFFGREILQQKFLDGYNVQKIFLGREKVAADNFRKKQKKEKKKRKKKRKKKKKKKRKKGDILMQVYSKLVHIQDSLYS